MSAADVGNKLRYLLIGMALASASALLFIAGFIYLHTKPRGK